MSPSRVSFQPLLLGALLTVFLLVVVGPLPSRAGEPNPPSWPSSVYVFDPTTPSQTQQVVDRLLDLMGGHNPPFNGQFSPYRFALLFKPGVHAVGMEVGFYTSVMGLGIAPTDTTIRDVNCENGDFDYTGGALSNFWRSVENIQVTPTQTWNNEPAPAMLWAVSQASPMRRIFVNGNLDLYEYNSGCCAGYSSGGFMADTIVTGNLNPGSQQQWLTRNSQVGTWNGGNWNMVFVGATGGIPPEHCSNNNGPPITTVGQAPVIAEKPYLVLNSDGVTYSIAVPPPEFNKAGPTTDYGAAKLIDLSDVYVAVDTDSVDTINAKLDSGLHLILTPGIYNLTGSIVVNNPNTVVLGIGFPTLVPQTGQSAIVVKGSEGVRVSGILLEAGPQSTGTLLYWGSNDAGNPSNPGVLSDCFARCGGTNNPAVQQVTVDTMVQIAQGNVVIDNTWLWRADHDITGEVYNSNNPNYNGLQVFEDNVIAYGLAVEHQLQDLVQWYGNNGKVYFFQSELPYDVTQQQFGDPGYVGFRVDNSVSQFEGYGMGVYSFFRDNDVTVANGIVTPSGAQIVAPFTVFLNGNGQITHVINGQGNTVQQGTPMTSYVC